jgi:hypothetical protein
MTNPYEADEAILRVEAPRVPGALVSPPREPATNGEPAPDHDATPERSVVVELTPDGARIHLD